MICAFHIPAAEPGTQSASHETGARSSNRPAFSWDTVLRALSVHKPTAWTDDEYARIARYDFLQTNYKNEAMAEQVKEFNPKIIIVGYKNLVVHYKPLGPPKGPAVRDGFTYTREFQHANVWLDLTKREGRVTWTASYPEATALSPRNGDNQVAAGALPCTMTFDRPITKSTCTISLYRLGDRKLMASVPVESDAVTTPDEKTVEVSFPITTEPKTGYSIVLSKGALRDRDDMIFLGMPMLGQWKFVTR